MAQQEDESKRSGGQSRRWLLALGVLGLGLIAGYAWWALSPETVRVPESVASLPLHQPCEDAAFTYEKAEGASPSRTVMRYGTSASADETNEFYFEWLAEAQCSFEQVDDITSISECGDPPGFLEGTLLVETDEKACRAVEFEFFGE